MMVQFTAVRVCCHAALPELSNLSTFNRLDALHHWCPPLHCLDESLVLLLVLRSTIKHRTVSQC